MDKTCSTCEFWYRETITKNGIPTKEGACRAIPPQVIVLPHPQGVQIASHWPPTGAHVWCGAWKLKFATEH